MNRPRSIQFKLTAAYTTILATTFALIGIGVWVALNQSIQETADRELHSRLEDVRRYVDGFSADDLAHLQEEFQEETLFSSSAANIRVSGLKGEGLFRTPGADAWPEEALNRAGLPQNGIAKTIRIKRELIRILTAPVRVGVVQIGLPIDEFEEVKNGFLWLIWLGSPVLLSLAAIGGYWMSGRALKPVDEISSAAAVIGAGKLSARLRTNGSGDELDRLSEVLNSMLARLESAFKRVTEFTADASHELRTPVAIIQTTGELMEARPRALEEHVRAWRTVGAETERMSRLIGDLLTLARTDAGQTNLEFGIVNLNALVRSTAEEMRMMAETKGLQMTVDAPGACEIQADDDALRRAIRILLDNAIKFTNAPGAVRVEVRNGGRVVVKVSDTGVGIQPEELPFIFERFYRVSKDRSRQNGGAGLGLAIGKWIVEKHGGEIQVESSHGQGCAFSILLPVIDFKN